MRLIVNRLVFLYLFMLPVSAQAKNNGQTTIEISGVLVNEPCDLAPDSSAINIDFGTIFKKNFANSSRTLSRHFSIKVINCDLSIGSKASFSFKGKESSVLPGMLSINEGEMRSLAIGFEDSRGKLLDINKSSDFFPLSTGDNVFNFGAYVQAEEGAMKKNDIIAGNFSASATLEINYQ
ncbi:TPA: type 1 fimbrial protein [Klebsiella aerogenes]|nr:type 1 fimbrial protein [Klebsiella aerogenes]